MPSQLPHLPVPQRTSESAWATGAGGSTFCGCQEGPCLPTSCAPPTWRAEAAPPAGLTTGRPGSERSHQSGTVRGEPGARDAPPRPQPCMACGQEGGERPCRRLCGGHWRGPHLTWTWQNRVVAPGGAGTCAPINSALRGPPPLPAGPSSSPSTRFLGPEITPWVLWSTTRPKPRPNRTLLGGLGKGPPASAQPCPQKPPALRRGSRNRAAQVHALIPTRPRGQSTLPSQGAAGRPAPAIPAPSLQPKLTLPPPPQPQARLPRGAGRGRTGGGVLGVLPTPATLQPGLSLVGSALGRQTEAPSKKELSSSHWPSEWLPHSSR